MMKIGFPKQDELYIKQQIAAGFYSNASELVRDAVRRLRENNQKTQLLLALEQGEDAIAAGRITPYSQEFMAESKERAKKRHAHKDTTNRPHVTPYEI